jgi:hypothetical protein
LAIVHDCKMFARKVCCPTRSDVNSDWKSGHRRAIEEKDCLIETV